MTIPNLRGLLGRTKKHWSGPTYDAFLSCKAACGALMRKDERGFFLEASARYDEPFTCSECEELWKVHEVVRASKGRDLRERYEARGQIVIQGQAAPARHTHRITSTIKKL